MKLVGRIALGLVALLAVALVVGALLPNRWRVEQSIVIDAPPARIHPFLDGLRRWPEWAVWNKEMAPKVVWTYEGPERGVGARWAWNGPVMGRGRMEIVRSDPAQGLEVDEAIESDQVNAHARFTYTVQGDATKVTWVDEGTLPPVIGGYLHGVLEDMLNENFSKGLTKLKAVVEAQPPPAPPAPQPALTGEAVDAGQAEATDAGTP